MNFEYIIWLVFAVTAMVATRSTLVWRYGAEQRANAIGMWAFAGCLSAADC